MAKYIYQHNKPLWFVNHGKTKILNDKEIIKPDDIEYIKQTYPDRIICIEEDVKNLDTFSGLKEIIVTQSNQIQELIDILKLTRNNTPDVIKLANSSESLDELNDKIIINEPNFRPTSKLDINYEDITVSGSAGDVITSTSEINISEKIKKLSLLKKKNNLK